jgi:hypothetical protein
MAASGSHFLHRCLMHAVPLFQYQNYLFLRSAGKDSNRHLNILTHLQEYELDIYGTLR